ncbi:MAG TPA: nucleotidyltransferase family protein [Ktedonobacteraceae bacterium]|nr:nucleotidyltransferase family protein [Ktedonobacteraceae bacterium]
MMVHSVAERTNRALTNGSALGGNLTTQTDRQHDKAVFTHWLNYITEDAHATGQRVNLASNEEFPRLIPVLCDCFTREELSGLVGEQLTSALLQMHRVEMLQNLLLESELQRVLCIFNEAAIPFMLFKGPVLAYTAYPNSHLRTYHDLDILIHASDVARAHDLLVQTGYSFYEEYRADAADEQRTAYHYSLQPPGMPFACIVELHTAPHASEIGTLSDLEVLWKNARPMVILGQPVAVMNPADHLLFLCWHYRFHGFTRLLWLYDLVMLLRFCGDTLDWDALMRAARDQRLATTLYYCLCWCRDLFGVAIPIRVFSRLRPPLVSRFVVERIALPDVEKGLSVASYQGQRVIARRAMVDSHRDLLKAGLRMLFPSPVALQKRYMDHSRLPLRLFFLFYFIHPWITLEKGCWNAFRRAGTRRKQRSVGKI